MKMKSRVVFFALVAILLLSFVIFSAITMMNPFHIITSSSQSSSSSSFNDEVQIGETHHQDHQLLLKVTSASRIHYTRNAKIQTTSDNDCLIKGDSHPWNNETLMRKYFLRHHSSTRIINDSSLLRLIALDLKENHRRCQETRKFTSLPLFPETLSEYHPPFGKCDKGSLFAMKHFDFDGARLMQQQQQQSDKNGTSSSPFSSLTPPLEENLRLFFSHHFSSHDQKFEDWIQSSTTLPLYYSKQSQLNHNNRHEIHLYPNYSQTFVKNKTRIWNHLSPVFESRTSTFLPTEHEQSHAGMLRILSILVSILEKYKINNYFITHGTLLGAYRNETNGFIPHDSDIDVALPSAAMNTLSKIWRKEFPRDMMLQSVETDPQFYIFNSRRSAIRIKDRYSCTFGIPSFKLKGRKKVKLPKIHQGFGIDLIPLEKRMKGKQMKILSSYFNTSDIYPLSAICFGGVVVPAPRRVRKVLQMIYGDDFETNRHVLPAHFGGLQAFPVLATAQCGGSKWALNFTSDEKLNAFFPRDDPSF